MNVIRNFLTFIKNNFTLFLFAAFALIIFKIYASTQKDALLESLLNPSATISAEKTELCEVEAMVITLEGAAGTAPYVFTYSINDGEEKEITSNNSGIAQINFFEVVPNTFTYKLVSVRDTTSEDISINNQEVTIVVNPRPIVDFTFDKNNVCAGELITFTPNITGVGGYTYEWIFEDGVTSNLESPSHSVEYYGCSPEDQTFRVTLTVVDANGCQNSEVKLVTVTQKPDLEFLDADGNDFNNCDNASPATPEYTINVANNSASPCVDSYEVDWGDGNTETNVTFPLQHTYLDLGIYTMKIRGIGDNGCFNELSYQVTNIGHPVGDLSSPAGPNNVCLPNAAVDFEISNFEGNWQETIYTIDFGDGSPTETYTHSQVLNDNLITHTYDKGSCDEPNGEYVATLTMVNLCSTTTTTFSDVKILEPSVAEFEAPDASCINTDIEFLNTSFIGQNCDCKINAKFAWDFGDGTLVNDNGATTATNQTHRYTSSGTYTVSLSITTKCGTDIFTKNICIEEENTPTFDLDTDAGCAPLAVTATNTTSENLLCSTATYEWEVTYAADNCETVSAWSFANGTNQNSQNPEFVFTNAGRYTLTQKMITGCGTATSSKVIEVKKPPTVTIDPIDDACDNLTINPIANVQNCTSNGAGIEYNWTFNGGNPVSSSTLDPGNIVYDTPGTYEITLEVTNECGTSNIATQTFQVFEKPSITNADRTQEICSKENTSEINLTSSLENTTYSWSAVGSNGISGFIANGNSSTIPSQTILNSQNTSGTLTYTVVPSLNGCDGDAAVFTITVNPAPEIITQPISSEVCANTPATLLEVSVQNITGIVSYQWFSNSIDSNAGGDLIAEATNSSYNPPTSAAGNVFYYVEISFSSGGCNPILSNTASVTVFEQLVINPIEANQTFCLGGNPKELEVSFTGGNTDDIDIQWFSNTTNSTNGGDPITGETKSNYTPETPAMVGSFYYYAEISSNTSGCATMQSDVFEIEVVPDPVITSQPIQRQEFCVGATPQDITVAVSGGTASSLNYQWYQINGATTTPVGTNAASYPPETNTVGTFSYYVVVTQSESDCAVTSEISEVTVNEGPQLTSQPNSSEVCLNGNATLLEVTFENGGSAPSYQWFSNTVGQNFGGTAIPDATNASYNPPTSVVGTTYYYAEINFTAGGCSVLKSSIASVTVADQVTVVNSFDKETICVDNVVGTLDIGISGGVGNPSYQWFSNTSNTSSGGTAIANETNKTYTPPIFAAPGSYYYYVEVNFDGSQCALATSDVFEVEVIDRLRIDAEPIVSQELCRDAVPAAISVSVSGGANTAKEYQWFSNTTNSNTGGSPIAGQVSNSLTPSTATVGTFYYYVVITEPASTCTTVSSVSELIVNEKASITQQPQASEVCENEIATLLEVVYQNGFGVPSYQWFSNTVNENTGGTAITNATANSFDPPTDTIGTLYYYAEISFPAGGCETLVTEVAVVTVREIPNISSAATTIYSGETFAFNPNAVVGNSIPSGTQYTWPSPSFAPSEAIIGAIEATTPQDNISQNLENTTNNPVVVSYLITPFTENCTGTPFTLEVTVNPGITSNPAVTNISCFQANDGSITTNIVGGVPFDTGAPYQVSWTGPNGFTSTNTAISNLEAGSYTLTIEDKNGYTITEEYTITQPDALTLATDTERNVSCFNGNDGIIEVTINGGTLPYTYNWSTVDGSGIVPNQKNQNSLTKGNYILEVVDQNNCSISTSFELTEPEELLVGLITKNDLQCFGDDTGTIEIDVSGGTPLEVSAGVFEYNYAWSGPDGYENTSKNITNLLAGNYTVLVTDNLGCTIEATYTIIQPDQIIVDVTKTDETCYQKNDGSIAVNLSGGTAPYSFVWSNSATELTLANLAPDTYTITVTDANNCTVQETIVINEALFYIEPTTTPMTCNSANDATINLNLTGGVAPISVVWSDGVDAGLQRENLAAGTYSVIIEDSNPGQCAIEQTFVVTNPPEIVITETVVDATDCEIENSGSINLEVTGGVAPLTFLWNTNETTEDLQNIGAGAYSVEISDANGCVVVREFTIIRPDPLDLTIEALLLTDCDLQTASKQITANGVGGVLPYTFTWSSGVVSGADNHVMTTDQTGEYSVTIADARGCTVVKSVDVEVPSIGDQDFSFTSFAFDNYNLFSIQDPIQFTNLSTGDYNQITWDFGDGSATTTEENPEHTFNSVGIYTIKLSIEYAAGCTYVLERPITVTKGYVLITPNAFTPNGDGVNDRMKPIYKGFSEIEIIIYSSWGTTVFSEKGLDLLGWDGFMEGAPAENGNYVMVVKGLTLYKGEIIETTPFTLIK